MWKESLEIQKILYLQQIMTFQKNTFPWIQKGLIWNVKQGNDSLFLGHFYAALVLDFNLFCFVFYLSVPIKYRIWAVRETFIEIWQKFYVCWIQKSCARYVYVCS